VGRLYNHRRILIASALTILSCVVVIELSTRLLDDGAIDLRHVKLAMHDEWTILSRVWRMVDEGSLHHRIHVYPGLYPYLVAGVRGLLGPEVSDATQIWIVRWLSLVSTLLALLVPLALLVRLTDSVTTAAVFTATVALHPETILWGGRVHPDALLLLFDHVSLALFALGVQRKKESFLYGATVAAALSAAIKLVGVFIMVCIFAYLIWRSRGAPRRMWRELLKHAALFGLVFVAFNPMLVLDAPWTIKGWVQQHQHARAGRQDPGGWLGHIIGPRGLGVATCLLLVTAAIRLLRKPRTHLWPYLWSFGGFALIYLTYLFGSVEATRPRYLVPAVWPLVLCSLVILRFPQQRRHQALWGVGAALLSVVFVTVDLPRRWEAVQADATTYVRQFDSDKQRVADALLELHQTHSGCVFSHHALYVPRQIQWRSSWELRRRNLERAEAFALVVNPLLRMKPDIEADLRSGAAGWRLWRNIGPYEIFTRGH